MSGPSAYHIEQAMAVAEATLARMREANELAEDTDEAALLAMLGEPGADITRLLERVVAAALEAEALADAAKLRLDQLAERRRRFERTAEAWRGAALAMMDTLGMQRHRAAEFTLTLGAGLPRVIVTDEARLAPEYFKVTRVPMLTAIKEDLAQGVIVDGAELSNGPPRLVVRTR